MIPDPESRLPEPTDLLSTDSLRLVLRASAKAADPEPTPLAHLIARLEQEDGPEWFAQRAAIPPWRDLPGGAATVATLRKLKDECKQAFRDGRELDAVLFGVAGYFLAIASALVHHRTAISTQPMHELRPLLIELATALPEPWSSLSSRAAFFDAAFFDAEGKAR